MVDSFDLKSIIEQLDDPPRLDHHVLAGADIVVEWTSRQSSPQAGGPGRALAHALADYWRNRFMPPKLSLEYKREWNTFFVLEVGHFFPLRKRRRLPTSLAQLGALLSDAEYLALVVADGDEAGARTLLEKEYEEFWAGMTPSEMAVPESTVSSRQKVALRKLSEELAKHSAGTAPTEILAPLAIIEDESPSPHSARELQQSHLQEFLNRLLQGAPDFVPPEWMPIIKQAFTTKSLIIRGQTGSGRTTLLRAIGPALASKGAMPLYVSLLNLGQLAHPMDLLRIAMEAADVRSLPCDEQEKDSLLHALAEAERAERLVILADDCDRLMETELAVAKMALARFNRFIYVEASPRLPFDSALSETACMPVLSRSSLLRILGSAATDPALDSLDELEKSGLTTNLEIAKLLATESTAAENRYHPVEALSSWVELRLKSPRMTLPLAGADDRAQMLLRRLAALRLGIREGEGRVKDLQREDMLRILWQSGFSATREDEGWLLIDLCERAGLIIREGDRWEFQNSAVCLYLAARHLADDDAYWVSLSPRHRQLMQWTGAILARRGHDSRTRVFFDGLLSELARSLPISWLEAADVLIEFNGFETPPVIRLRRAALDALKNLGKSDSATVRRLASGRCRLLGFEEAVPEEEDRAETLIPRETLDSLAGDLPDLLRRLGAPVRAGEEHRWLEDRTVLRALLDGLAVGSDLPLKSRCAAWLRRSTLTPVIEVTIRALRPWKSRPRTALEVVADIAGDSTANEFTRLAARTVLANDVHVLRLLEFGERYEAVLYDLLLAMEKRVFFRDSKSAISI